MHDPSLCQLIPNMQGKYVNRSDISSVGKSYHCLRAGRPSSRTGHEGWQFWNVRHRDCCFCSDRLPLPMFSLLGNADPKSAPSHQLEIPELVRRKTPANAIAASDKQSDQQCIHSCTRIKRATHVNIVS